MQLFHTFCCILLTITVAVTYVQSQSSGNEVSTSKVEKRIVKREASIIIDSYPLESMIKRNPRVVVKRVSRGRYRKPKPKYGPPTRKPIGRSRRPYQKKSSKKPVKYPPPGFKKGSTKPSHKRTRPPKSKYGPPKHIPPQTYKAPEPEGFGEPPSLYPPHDNLTPKPNYGEPPVDSYGAPLRTPNVNYPAAQHFEESQFYGINRDKDHSIWSDQNAAFSNKHQVYAKPDIDMDHTEHVPIDLNDDFNLFAHHLRRKPNMPDLLNAEKKIRLPESESPKYATRPWRSPQAFEDDDDKILVGGQNAEPPARYVPKFQPSAPMYAGDDDFAPPGFVDSEIPSSATMSPYVNYKNSNLAFSPQNLNDAFSIVDK